MEDDSSNDVIAMETSVLPREESPIIQFFKRLIVNNSSQNTMLTNAQIQDILTKEFHFDLTKLHELEIEIYINILKKYLKDWPIWDDFDHTAKLLTSRGDEESLGKLLEDRYENLKCFLQSNLDIAKPLAKECVAKIQNKQKSLFKQDIQLPESDNVVLEIQATREQLNTLFLRYPDGDTNTIFKYSENTIPKHITVNTLRMEAIFNWWSVVVTINLQWCPSTTNVFLKHETIHKFDHVLVNRKVKKPENLVTSLNTNVQFKAPKKVSQVSGRQLNACLDLLETQAKVSVASEEMKIILDCFRRDLARIPVCVALAQYRGYYSKYPYVRYLYANSDEIQNNDGKYDIQLKETISPMYQFSIGKVDGNIDKALPANWLKLDCVACNKSFIGDQLGMELRQHFDEYHQMEPDWQCTNCLKSYPMSFLAWSSWCHDCE